MQNKVLLAVAAFVASASPAWSQAHNVILFIGDGAGVSSLNAASISGYGEPRALYIQRMPHLALADTSTAKEWVTDAAASATAWATGHKKVASGLRRDMRTGGSAATQSESDLF